MGTKVTCAECGRSLKATHSTQPARYEREAASRQLRETCKLGFRLCALSPGFVPKRLEPAE